MKKDSTTKNKISNFGPFSKETIEEIQKIAKEEWGWKAEMTVEQAKEVLFLDVRRLNLLHEMDQNNNET